MKNLLFFVSGGLLGAWLLNNVGKPKKKVCEDNTLADTAVSKVLTLPAVEPAIEPAVVPDNLIQRYDASSTATVSPAMVTISSGAITTDDITTANLYDLAGR